VRPDRAGVVAEDKLLLRVLRGLQRGDLRRAQVRQEREVLGAALAVGTARVRGVGRAVAFPLRTRQAGARKGGQSIRTTGRSGSSP
jgi:hypothetical protein